MKIPKRIKIGCHWIRIKKVRSNEIQERGIYNSWYQLIKLNCDDNIKSAIDEAFLHEIIEAIVKIYNLSIDHTHLTVLSEIVFTVIRNNQLDFRK